MVAPTHLSADPVTALAFVTDQLVIQHSTRPWHLDELSPPERKVVLAASARGLSGRETDIVGRLRSLFRIVFRGRLRHKMALASALLGEATAIHETWSAAALVKAQTAVAKAEAALAKAKAATAAAAAAAAIVPPPPRAPGTAPRPHGPQAPALDALARWAVREARCPRTGRIRAHRLEAARRVTLGVLHTNPAWRPHNRTERALDRSFRAFAADDLVQRGFREFLKGPPAPSG